MAEHAGAPVRVLLLARAGEARQRLEAALGEAGAELVRSVDPLEADPGQIRALQPGAVLVALEPAIEDALDAYDALLSDPGVLVMFDEADLAARRDGWDAARWVRHLAAKLHGHRNVLPEGTEAEDVGLPEPGIPREQALDSPAADLAGFDLGAQELAAGVPRADSFDVPFAAPGHEPVIDPEPAAPEPAAPAPDDGVEAPRRDAAGDADTPIDFDFGDFADSTDFTGSTSSDIATGLVAAEDMDWSSSAAGDDGLLGDDPALAELLASAAAAQSRDAGHDSPVPGLDDALFLEPLDEGGSRAEGPDADANAATATQPVEDPGEAPAVDRLSFGSSLSLADDDTPLATRSDEGGFDLAALEARAGGLSLADDDGPIMVRPPIEEVDPGALEGRLGGLSLADPDSYGHGVLRGAVMVEAGLGGPDAVRQLLGGLGEAFGRPVLVRLQLDGGRYERLVQQMQRASVLPVALAEAGGEAQGGVVYFLPPDIALVNERSRLRFAAMEPGAAVDYGALPAPDSALVFLSGASADRIDRAMALSDAGALVLAQSPDSCYDAAAVNALVARGAVAAEPGDLAQALIDRWP